MEKRNNWMPRQIILNSVFPISTNYLIMWGASCCYFGDEGRAFWSRMIWTEQKLVWKEGHLDGGNSLRKGTRVQGLFGGTCHRPGCSWVGDDAKMMDLDLLMEGFDYRRQWAGKESLWASSDMPRSEPLEGDSSSNVQKSQHLRYWWGKAIQ